MKFKVRFLLITCLILSPILLAACETPKYDLSTSCTPEGGGTASPKAGVYERGEEVTLIATPAQYYRFDGWGGDASGTSTHLTIKMDSDKIIVASFVRITYSLTAQVNPSGSGSVDPESGTYDAGTQLTIRATPTSGYRFDHWGGSASGSSNPVSILVDNNKNLTAYFTKVFTLSTSCIPAEGGSVSPKPGLYDAGSTVTVEATPAFPYVFTNWSGADNNYLNPTTVTMSSDKSLAAYFRKQNPGSQQTVTGLYRGLEKRIPITLAAGQWVQGGIISGSYEIPVRIIDPLFDVALDLGSILNTSFTFQAETSGVYYIDILYSIQYRDTDYTVKYTTYS